MSKAQKRIPRVIPCLLLKGNGLTKTVGFKDYTYLGDAINTCRIFNEKEVDELIFLDIEASKENRGPRIEFLRQIASECFMPLGYGGGVTKLEHFDALFKAGFEKVSINSSIYSNPDLVDHAAKAFGSQSVVVSLDVRKHLIGGYKLYSKSGTQAEKPKVAEFAKEMENRGAGEIIVNSIDLDGKMGGYDSKLIQDVASAVSVPVIALGGAGTLQHLVDAYKVGASAVAAGSLFVFHGRHRAVLITYPNRAKLKELFS